MWALPGDSVRTVVRRGTAFGVRTVHSAVRADEVLGLTFRLKVRPCGRLVERYWNEPCAGLAAVAGVPVVVVRSEHPPHALHDEGDGVDGQ